MANEKKTVKPVRKPAKPLKEGFVKLIENELEKTELVIATKAVPDKLQGMAEDLAKIEADDVMPLLDQLKTAFGPQVSDRFSQAVTAKVRELLDAVKGAKDVIDTEISNIERAANGEPANDMAADAAQGLPPGGGGGGDLDIDDDGGNDEMPDVGDMGEGGGEAGPLDVGGAAGRAKKENINFRLTAAARALRESKNPDALILKTFRTKLAESRRGTAKRVLESVAETAKFYGIDQGDVISIIQEAKKAAEKKSEDDKPLEAHGTKGVKSPPWRKKFKNQAAFEKWLDAQEGNVDVTASRKLDEAKQKPENGKFVPFKKGENFSKKKVKETTVYKAEMNPRTRWYNIVNEAGKVVKSDVTANEDHAKDLASKFKPRKKISEAVPVPPQTPADKRARQRGELPQGVQQPGGNAQQPPPAPAQSRPVQQTQQSQTPQQNPQQPGQIQQQPVKPPAAPFLPGKVMTQAPAVPQNTIKPGSQPPKQSASTASSASFPKATAPANGQDRTTSGPKAVGTNPSNSLMSKTVPLPKPGSTLMGGTPAAPKSQQQGVNDPSLKGRASRGETVTEQKRRRG